MKLFNTSQLEQIKQVAERSRETLEPPKTSTNSRSINSELQEISKRVIDYFKDSPAILITTKNELHDYVTKVIESGYAGVDCETTGLDRVKDHVVGSSLYYPGGVECYIPNKHLIPIFEEPYKNQLTYEEVCEEFQRLVDAKVRLIFANADFDLAMIRKDIGVDLSPAFYYDVILAWRCLKEDEPDNKLKILYNKYVLKGKGDPKTFSDFFPVKLFPYCKPEIAKLYAAHDAIITYELFRWQLPYTDKNNPKCQKAHLESIADMIWNVEFPLVRICHEMHRTGVHLDRPVANRIRNRYSTKYEKEIKVLQDMVQEILDNSNYLPSFGTKVPFNSGKDFNQDSTKHVQYLLYSVMQIPPGKDKSVDKNVLGELNLPVTDQILKVRSLRTLISTFVEKLPNATTSDSRIHARFNQIGADTGRMSSADPNMQNIPSHATDIRHMFRATPGYVMMSSDYSQQEPKLTAFLSQDEAMIEGFKAGQDAYAMIASVAYGLPYEECLEFNPITHEYQPEGKKRRSECKSVLLGVLYGRSVATIADQLFGKENLSDEDKVKKGQQVFDAVMNAFPGLRNFMNHSQHFATRYGYVTTILGRRRHIPDMQLPEFEFKAMNGYVNPDIDPMDIQTLDSQFEIPERIQKQLLEEFRGYKYFGAIAKRTKELSAEKIKVVNNRHKITEASRQCVNSRVQGSAADLTKLAILRLENDERWKKIGGRLLIPVHDELICEVPMDCVEEASRILSEDMSAAGSFLPFPINCDVETTLRWYGLPYPCPFEKPEDIEDPSENAVSWIQYCLTECEYQLPVFKNADGIKPKGIAARGVNGRYSEEMDSYIDDYCKTYGIGRDKFLDHIENVVFYCDHTKSL